MYVRGHTGISGTLPLTEAAVSANAAGEVQLTGAGARVHGNGLLDDEAIGNELADGLAGVGIADLADLIGIEPDLSLADAEDRGGQALLGGEIDPREALQLARRAKSRGIGPAGGLAEHAVVTVAGVRQAASPGAIARPSSIKKYKIWMLAVEALLWEVVGILTS